MTFKIANKMNAHGEKMDGILVVEKISRIMIVRLEYDVCFIEEFTTISIDELKRSLLVHEQIIKAYNEKDSEKAI